MKKLFLLIIISLLCTSSVFAARAISKINNKTIKIRETQVKETQITLKELIQEKQYVLSELNDLENEYLFRKQLLTQQLNDINETITKAKALGIIE